MSLLDRLNPAQKEAALHTEGPLLILAGAGSGKTRVIITRIAQLIQGQGVSPYAILAVTFTNKAAAEMRERVIEALGEGGLAPTPTPTVSTFHSFCVRLLRFEGDALKRLRPSFTRQFNIYDDADQLTVIRGVFKELGLEDKTFMKPRAALSIISQAKNQGQSYQDFYNQATSPTSERLATVYEKYQNALLGSNAFDFDDLLLEAVRLLKLSDEVRAKISERYRYVMVDEYQDTNRPQYDLLRLLSDTHDNVCVVGDEDQSIYSWRGAEIRNILDFERDFPNAKTIRLEQNYRSTRTILDAAGAVVANNLARKGKQLWTQDDAGDPILFYQGRDAEAEALFVADYIHRHLIENPESRTAVLYRTNAQSRQMEEALRRFSREYLVVGGVSFYQRAEVKDLISYLKAAQTPEDSVALLRIINVPARGIGKTTIEQLQQFAAEHRLSIWEAIGRMLEQRLFGARAQAALRLFRQLLKQLAVKVAEKPVDEALQHIYRDTGYERMLMQDPSIEAESRRENIDELLNAAADAAQRDESLQDFLDHAALVSEADKIDDRAQVLLMTLHNAKGLEFPVVAMIGLEEGLFPHSRSIDDEGALEEERRLCYVGMTRAQRQLILTCARTRRRFGGGSPEAMTASRFLKEVPSELIEDRTVGGSRAVGRPELFDDTATEADLFSDRHEVRRIAESRLAAAGARFAGAPRNSADAVAQFFGRPVAAGEDPGEPARTPTAQQAVPTRQPQRAARPATAAAKPGVLNHGVKVKHQRYGVGKVVRREGDGEEAKVTVMFQRHGLKKMIVKYAGLQPV